MKITSITTDVVAIPFELGGPHTRFAGVPWTHQETLLVRVETEDGLVGWGESFGHASIPVTRVALERVVAPLVLGQDAEDIVALTKSVLHGTHLLGRNGPFVYAFSGIEIALWDLLGKRAGLPLRALLGAPGGVELNAYASLMDYPTDSLVAKNARAAVDEGYSYVKLHQTTRSAVLAAQEAVDVPLMLDTNCAWNVPQAIELARQLRGDGLHWLEEPVWPPEDAEGLARVRTQGAPIAAGENVAGFYGFKTLMDAGALDYAQPSVTKVGGIGEILRIAALAQSRGVQLVMHSPYFGPGFLATLHIAASLPVRPLVEVSWVELEASPFTPWVRQQDGKLAVPELPGLGCDPDVAVVEKYRKGPPVTLSAADFV